jgi:hypothetical protein
MFSLIMTELCGRQEPFFRPRFLGDKYPTFDYIVELVDQPEYFFFVQVKATTQGYNKNPVRLKVQVSQTDVDRMVACPAPAYVVGIDETRETGYLLSVNEARDHVASLTTSFKIDCGVLSALADEVQQFWSNRNMVLTGSRFKE